MQWAAGVRGRPIGKFCFKCLSVVLSVYPGQEAEDVVALYKSDDSVKVELDKALEIYDKIQEQAFKASSQVGSLSEQGYMVSFKVAFVPEGDLVRMLKVSPNALKLPSCVLQLEQFGQEVKGFVLSMNNLPKELQQVSHTVKVYSKTAIHLSDEVLASGRMLSEKQPMRMFGHLSAAQTERAPAGFRCNQRQHLPTFDTLAERAAKILEAILSTSVSQGSCGCSLCRWGGVGCGNATTRSYSSSSRF